MRPEVVAFLEAQALRAEAAIARAKAEGKYRRFADRFDAAWEALTPEEQEMVNDACRGSRSKVDA